MTLLATYATPTEIRAVLGVNDTELGDAVLASAMYPLHADLALDDIDAGVRPMFLTISGKSENTRTTAETRFYDLVRMFAQFVIGKLLVGSLPLFSVKRLTDGRAEFERNVDYYADLREYIDSSYINFQVRVQNQYNALVPTYNVPLPVSDVVVQLSTLATDPVTANA